MEVNKVIQGDCLIKLKELEDNSVDSIVTDPPYHLVSIVKRFGKENSAPAKFGTDGAFSRASKGFMGKTWDGLGEDGIGIAQKVELWAECLRVLKPGGHLLAFSGTRTYHRMACAIEDAGFEVRDMIEWCYGSGFPKSHNIGKAVDKLQGNEREVLGKNSDFSRDGAKRNGLKHQTVKEVGQKIGHKYGFGSAWESEVTKGTSEWEGWGTALKPAHEPICMARKPLDRWWKIKDDGKKVMGRVMTVAENCLKWGTGGINIDESRVGTEEITTQGGDKFKGDGIYNKYATCKETTHTGRFPANLIHDNSEEVRECFPETKSGTLNSGHKRGDGTGNSFMGGGGTVTGNYGGDSGNASRFFKSILYYPKASKSERNKGCEDLDTTEKFTAGNYSQSPTCKDCGKTLNGTNDHSKCSGEVYYKEMESKNTKNNHPTVKPIALMEYLIKMVTPKGGIVLDPFAGSGSTLVAAKQNGFQYIGIELTEEYIPIIEARLNALNQYKLL